MEKTNLFTFRICEKVDYAEMSPSMRVDVEVSAGERWPELVKIFLNGLRAVGYVIQKDKLQEAFQEIVEEWE